MKAHITYTADGTITSLAIGDGLLEAGEGISAEVDLPDDFPSLSGENAEAKVTKAVARLVVKPGTGTLEARS
jgi:hypothetical protein